MIILLSNIYEAIVIIFQITAGFGWQPETTLSVPLPSLLHPHSSAESVCILLNISDSRDGVWSSMK